MPATLLVAGIADPGKGAPGTMFWTRAELEALVRENRVQGLQVWLEHGDATREVIGTVARAFVSDAGLHVLVRSNTEPAVAQAIAAWIKNGVFSGFSLGYNVHMDARFRVTAKDLHEISIVQTPYWPEARICAACMA